MRGPAASPYAAARQPALRVSVARLQNACLWLTGAASSIVFIEPSPYEISMALTVVVFALTGLALRPQVLPLTLLFGIINIGFTISASDMLDQREIMNWIVTSWFLMVTCIFFAAALSANTEARANALINGTLVAAAIAAIAGTLAYFRLLPGLYDLLTLYDRARGTFKDPNVLGAFLIFPAIVALQRMVIGNVGQMARYALLLGVLSLGILLAFSRAAWGQLVFTGALMLFFMMITTRSPGERAKIILMAVAALFAAVVLLIILLSVPAVSDLFKQRASLSQSYDMGEQGRFARHVLGAILALDKPWGIGPLQFSTIFPEDTHNSYLNAFMSGGWIAGVTYPTLVLLTLFHGLRHVFVAAPWQRTYIAVYSAFLGTALESAIIDTDHWRHYFMLIGAVWGIMIANRNWLAEQRAGVGSDRISRPTSGTWRALAPPGPAA